MIYDSARVRERLSTMATDHLAPYSTLVVCMGDHFAGDSLASINAMVEYTNNFLIRRVWNVDGADERKESEPFAPFARRWFERDRCFNWGDSLGSMRNMGYRAAIEKGFEWLLYVDNDVILPEYTLVQLLHHQMPIVAPKLKFTISLPEKMQRNLSTMKLAEDSGLALVGSVLLSCILFKTTIFLPYIAHDFWGNAIGDDEEYHFTKLYLSGIRPCVDTDLQVTCTRHPSFPLDRRPSHA